MNNNANKDVGLSSYCIIRKILTMSLELDKALFDDLILLSQYRDRINGLMDICTYQPFSRPPQHRLLESKSATRHSISTLLTTIYYNN